MGTFYLAPTKNYTQKALNGSINDTVQTITLNNTTDMQFPGYIVVDRVNAAGTATPNSREVISYTGISGNNLTGCTRGADGSTARSHNDTAIVETMPTVGMWNNLATIVSTGFTGDGYLKAINSPVSISAAFLTNIINSAVTISTSLNASGASVVGIYPSGASGSVLISRGNSALPVFAAVPRVKVGTFTRDLTTATGNQTISGVGFKLTSLDILASFTGSADKASSVGFADASSSRCQSQDDQGKMSHTNDLVVIWNTYPGVNQSGTLGSTYDDGFIISWTRNGNASGTAQLSYRAIG